MKFFQWTFASGLIGTLASAGCVGGAGSNDDTDAMTCDPEASCTTTSDQGTVCLESNLGQVVQDSCEGTYAASACDLTDTVGGCESVDNSGDYCLTVWFYDMSEDDGRALCQAPDTFVLP